MLPPTEEEEHVLTESGVEGVADPSSSQTASKLRHLLDETADLIDSPSFSFVLTLLNNEGFSTLVDVKCMNEAFKAPPVPETAPQSLDSMATVIPPSASDRKTKLANLLAVLARQAHVVGNGTHPPNEYLNAMEQNVRELEAFSAVIYSSNFDLELLGASRRKAENEAAAPPSPREPENGFGGNDLGEQSQQISQEGTADSAFEQAWGKAVEDGKSSPAEGPAV